MFTTYCPVVWLYNLFVSQDVIQLLFMNLTKWAVWIIDESLIMSCDLEHALTVHCVQRHVCSIMSAASCLQRHVCSVMSTASCLQHYVCSVMCAASCVQRHVYSVMCAASCLQRHVCSVMFGASCLQHHVYSVMSAASCLRRHVCSVMSAASCLQCHVCSVMCAASCLQLHDGPWWQENMDVDCWMWIDVFMGARRNFRRGWAKPKMAPNND